MSTKLLRYKYTIYWHKFTHLIINSPNNKLSYFVAYVAQAHYGGAASHQFHPRGAPTRLCNAASTRRVHRPPPSVPLAYYKRGYLAGHRHRSAPPRLPATPSVANCERQDKMAHQLYPPALLVPAARGGSGQQRRRRRSGPPRGSTVEARAVVGYSYGDDDGTNLPDRRHAGTSLNSGETR